MSDFIEDSYVPDGENQSENTLERLKNITKMFSGKEEEHQELQKVEKLAPSEKLKRTFRKFEEIGSSIDQIDEEEEEEEEGAENNNNGENGTVRSARRKRAPKEHIPYHEMAEVKDKFEKGLVDANKPRTEKRLDVRVQSGITSSKKQAFEQGEFEQVTESHVSKIDIETDLISGLTSAKKQVFERQQSTEISRTTIPEHDVLVGLATENKAKFENGQIKDRPRTSLCTDEIASIVGSGLAQAKRSEILSKIDAEQQIQRSADRSMDYDTEQGLAIARREQLASLANSEYKPAEKSIDVTAGLANTIKEQYIADASRKLSKTSVSTIDNELLERGVAKERAAMFKNLENGFQMTNSIQLGDSKIRVDENGNVVRESDKREEIYFEKGQTKQLVEQWKTKQLSPDRDSTDASNARDAELVEQGKAKNLVQMWKTIDKENTPPPERPRPRAITPPADHERRVLPVEDEENNSSQPAVIDDTANIESGYAKAIRERFLQNAEQNNTINKRKALKQFTPPPELPNSNERKSVTPPRNESESLLEEVLPNKGQAQSLKNRFIELEQDALKVETASSKIRYVPKRFVNTPAPKQISNDTISDPNKCSACCKTVYAMEKIEADKKVYHKSCFKCMHCKSVLKLGNYTANDGQIYCKPHFLQLFAIKGNYSAGFGLDDHKTRWSNGE